MYNRPRKPPLPTEEWAEMHHWVLSSQQGRKREISVGLGWPSEKEEHFGGEVVSGDMVNQVEEG